MLCNYCNKPAVWVQNKEIYGVNYGRSYMVWLCRPCDAYVGCHSNTRRSLGTLANRRLRALRKTAKDLFIDKKLGGTWKCNHTLKNSAYWWLKTKFGLREDEAHFGMFNEEMCLKVIAKLNEEELYKDIGSFIDQMVLDQPSEYELTEII